MQYLSTQVRQNLGFHKPQNDYAALEEGMTIEFRASLSSPCDFFFQILKRTDLKECALPSHSTAQSHITTATLAIKSRAIHCSGHGSIAF